MSDSIKCSSSHTLGLPAREQDAVYPGTTNESKTMLCKIKPSLENLNISFTSH